MFKQHSPSRLEETRERKGINMACCTTISPVSSPKKRGASSMFELPKTAKRRRGATLGTTMLTTLNTASGNSATSAAALFNFSNSPMTSTNSTPSCFDINVPFTTHSYSRGGGEDDSSSSSDTDDIMHRIKKEAKRLLKRKVIFIHFVRLIEIIY